MPRSPGLGQAKGCNERELLRDEIQWLHHHPSSSAPGVAAAQSQPVCGRVFARPLPAAGFCAYSPAAPFGRSRRHARKPECCCIGLNSGSGAWFGETWTGAILNLEEKRRVLAAAFVQHFNTSYNIADAVHTEHTIGSFLYQWLLLWRPVHTTSLLTLRGGRVSMLLAFRTTQLV